VSKFRGILFTPVRYAVEVCYAAGPLKVRVSLWSQNGPPPPKPLQQPWFICQHIATVHLSQVTNTVPDTTCFSLSLILESFVGWISTLAYEMSTNCWPERFSVVCCTHIFQIKLMLKKWEIYTKIYVYSYQIAPRHASCSAGVICMGCWEVTCNTQLPIY